MSILVKRKGGNGFFRISNDRKTIKDFSIKELTTIVRNHGIKIRKLSKKDYENEKTLKFIKDNLWRICTENNLI